MTVLSEMTEVPHNGCTNSPEPSGSEPHSGIPSFMNAVDSMHNRLVHQEAVHFRNQSRDEAPLTVSEKLIIAGDLYRRNPGVYLERFGRYLNWAEDNVNFRHLYPQDDVVQYFVDQLDKRWDEGRSNQLLDISEHRVRNRRLNALKRLDRDGDTEHLSAEHFSHSAMRHRDPILWESMIGAYLNESERRKFLDHEYSTFSGFLMDSILREKEAQEWQQARQDEISTQHLLAASDTSSETDDNDSIGSHGADFSVEGLRQEFMELMRLRFVNGQDKDFDYGPIDNDESLDEDIQEDLDAEERYFDAD